MAKFVNVATPLTAVTVAVPPRDPEPVVKVAVTLAVELVRFPKASTILITG
jgi:hypothetical protein